MAVTGRYPELALSTAPDAAITPVAMGINDPALRSKAVVRAATTANITISTALNNGDSLDGVTLATNDRVLVKDQTTAADNGIYVVGASPGRAPDADAWNAKILGAEVYVSEGTVNKRSTWMNVNQEGGTLNTTAIWYTNARTRTGDRWDPALLPTGALYDNMERWRTNYQRLVDTSGTICVAIGPTIPAGTAVSQVALYCQTVSASLTHSWAGIAAGPKEANARTVLAVSTDKTTSNWGANAYRTDLTWTAWVPDRDTQLYIFWCQVGTTLGRLVGTGFQTSAIWSATGGTPIVLGTSDTGQTTPPSVGATLGALTAGTDGMPYYYLA